MTEVSPADVALYDQSVAAIGEILDTGIAEFREAREIDGELLTTGNLMAALMMGGDYLNVCALATVAIQRLARQ